MHSEWFANIYDRKSSFKQKMKIIRKLLKQFYSSVQQNYVFQTWEQIRNFWRILEKSNNEKIDLSCLFLNYALYLK